MQACTQGLRPKRPQVTSRRQAEVLGCIQGHSSPSLCCWDCKPSLGPFPPQLQARQDRSWAMRWWCWRSCLLRCRWVGVHAIFFFLAGQRWMPNIRTLSAPGSPPFCQLATLACLTGAGKPSLPHRARPAAVAAGRSLPFIPCLQCMHLRTGVAKIRSWVGGPHAPPCPAHMRCPAPPALQFILEEKSLGDLRVQVRGTFPCLSTHLGAHVTHAGVQPPRPAPCPAPCKNSAPCARSETRTALAGHPAAAPGRGHRGGMGRGAVHVRAAAAVLPGGPQWAAHGGRRRSVGRIHPPAGAAERGELLRGGIGSSSSSSSSSRACVCMNTLVSANHQFRVCGPRSP